MLNASDFLTLLPSAHSTSAKVYSATTFNHAVYVVIDTEGDRTLLLYDGVALHVHLSSDVPTESVRVHQHNRRQVLAS